MTPFNWFFTFIKRYLWRIAIALFLVAFVSALAIIGPHISGIIVDDVILGGEVHLLGKLILFLIGATILRSVLRFIYLMLFERVSQDMLYSMRDSVYKRLLEQDFNFYNKNRTGDLMSRQTGDMDAIRHFVAFTTYSIFENVLLFIFALIMIFTVDYRLFLCMIAVLPFSAYVTYRQSKAIKPAFFKIRNCFSALNTAVQENISGNRVVKAFTKEDFEIEKFNKHNDAYMDAELGATAIWSKFVPIFEFLSSFLNVILALIGGIMVVKGTMSLGNLVTVNAYLWMLNNPLRMAGWLVNDLFRFSTSVEKIYSTIKPDPTVKRPNNPINLGNITGSIDFNHISYVADDDVILKDITFSVKHGQKIGIIGATGSGKSTLMNLLCRFYDVTDGEILVNNVNIKELDLYDLRSNIGMAMQDVFLFSDTIEGNIAYARPDCPFERVEEVAKIANAHDFIMKMSDGYDTIVGERGMGLSGGQKQRISLARALLKDPSIVILDDTTSAVDMETETQIQNELNSIGEDRTVFIIAHRISSIMEADVILVLDDGELVEIGNHNTLLDKKGYYYTVFNHQYGEFDKFKELGGDINGTK